MFSTVPKVSKNSVKYIDEGKEPLIEDIIHLNTERGGCPDRGSNDL